MSKQDADKEYYRLWWEYLRRSDDYRNFCNEFDDLCKKEEWPISSSEWPCLPDSLRLYILNEKIQQKLLKSKFWGNLFAFGNVFIDSFDEWYPEHKMRQQAWEKQYPPVSHLYDDIESIIDRCISDFERFYAREPTLGELKVELKEAFKNSQECVYLRINCKKPYELKRMTNMCADLIGKKRDQKTSFKFDLFYKAFDRPSSRIDFRALEKNLKVYDLRIAGLKYKEIIKKVGETADVNRCDDRELQSYYGRYFRKAQKTIKNVESGIFP